MTSITRRPQRRALDSRRHHRALRSIRPGTPYHGHRAVSHRVRGSDFEKTFRDFIAYGTPFTSPEDAFHQVEITAPGGLGGHGRVDRGTVMGLFPPLPTRSATTLSCTWRFLLLMEPCSQPRTLTGPARSRGEDGIPGSRSRRCTTCSRSKSGTTSQAWAPPAPCALGTSDWPAGERGAPGTGVHPSLPATEHGQDKRPPHPARARNDRPDPGIGLV